MTPRDVPSLRNRLRAVNMEFSALVRDRGSEGRFVRLADLKAERGALMALIHGIKPAHERRLPGALGSRRRRRYSDALQAAE